MAWDLVFDGDCGFCTTSARFLERRVARRSASSFVVVPWQRADLAALGLTEEACAAAVQLVGDDGRTYAGGAAIAGALRAGRMPWPPVGRILGLPGIRGLAEVAYRWVAAHRYQLPGGTPACRMPPAS
jgi:predicted DCC family thiol-disulfide oxidoreductase YuxK